MTQSTGHPIHGLHDKLFFGPDGKIVHNTFFLDDQYICFKLGNRHFDIDHLRARNNLNSGKSEDTYKGLYPLVRIWEGSGHFADYSYTFEDTATDQISSFLTVSKEVNKKITLFGGIVITAHYDGTWHPIDTDTFDAYTDWLSDIYVPIDESACEALEWICKIRTEARPRLLMPREQIFISDKLALENKKLPVVVENKEPLEEIIKPVPLSGQTSQLDKGVDALEVIAVEQAA